MQTKGVHAVHAIQYMLVVGGEADDPHLCVSMQLFPIDFARGGIVFALPGWTAWNSGKEPRACAPAMKMAQSHTTDKSVGLAGCKHMPVAHLATVNTYKTHPAEVVQKNRIKKIRTTPHLHLKIFKTDRCSEKRPEWARCLGL